MREPSDYGSACLARHHQLAIELADKRKTRARVKDQTLIDKLYLNGGINEREFDAAERFRRDYEAAHITMMPLSNPNRTTRSAPISITNRQADAMVRVASALDYIQSHSSAADFFMEAMIRDTNIKTKKARRTFKRCCQLLDEYYH